MAESALLHAYVFQLQQAEVDAQGFAKHIMLKQVGSK
jgi:hypothetical protein